MKYLLFPFLLCLPWSTSSAAEDRKHSEIRPNIITVFIDDMGWSDLSCFGGKTTNTENIDRLATEGIKFTNFYVNSPICSPSRVALTTGQYPQRWRITSYLNNRKSNQNRGMAQWLDPKAPVLARELQRNGYATGHFGKWHMGGQRDVNDAPPITAYGFDRSLTNFEGMGPKLLPLTLKPGQDPQKPGRIWQKAVILGEPVTWMQRSHITKGFVDAALEFIDESQRAEKPFFVNLWPDDVHSPFFPPVEKWAGGDKRTLYYAVLDAMDEQLAPLFARIRNDEKLRNNTLILVCSDNGHEEGAGRSDPLRGAKTWLYEGGIRSPLIAWGPGLLAPKMAGKTNDDSVFCALDLNRSLYALTATAPPANVTLDGENLLPTLLGKASESRNAPIFWRRPPDRPGRKGQDNPDLAVRDGKWKFLVNYDGSDPQLYHLRKDPGEQHNVAENFPTIVKALRTKLEKWNSAMPQDAGFPKPKDGVVPTSKFVNPIGEGADPWILRDEKNHRYLWCFSDGNRGIAIHTSERLSALGEKHIVWTAPPEGPVSKQVWAPELHFLDGHWHIYFAASDGNNENHLAYVLRSQTDDPLGKYDLHGPFTTGEGDDGKSPNIWAIDMTVLEHRGRRYALWSGWDAPGTDRQYLYIAPMKSPTELAGPRVRICSNDDFPWEFTEENRKGRGLNEGPQVLKTGQRTLVIYSCGASWLPTYKLGMLELVGDNPLDPTSWKKHAEPVFDRTEQTFGAGHSCFVKSPDRTEWWHVFHAKRDPNPGWRRAIFVQPMKFTDHGYPEFGKPVPPGSILDRPSGEITRPIPIGADYILPYNPGIWNFEDWSYYGHHQLLQGNGGLLLGFVPKESVNLYRCGEKAVFNHAVPRDFYLDVGIGFLGKRDARDAGVLFRTSGPSVGYDAQRGYFAGLIPRTNLLILGRMDGRNWTELARAETKIDPNVSEHLTVEVTGNRFIISHDGGAEISFEDATYPTGTIGLRVVDSAAEFVDFHLQPGPPPETEPETETEPEPEPKAPDK